MIGNVRIVVNAVKGSFSVAGAVVRSENLPNEFLPAVG
jgi:hypothetical protein